MERDLRILTLYKQHYLNVYDTPLESEYSCWGYYDGISIKSMEKKESKLFKKKTASPISELWYNSMLQTERLKGLYSKQNIGIFRCVDDQQKDNGINFWNSNKNMPFFGVGFLQLKCKKNYEKVSVDIEDTYKDNVTGDIKYGVITYCTFDNADLIILLHGNRLQKLEDVILDIEDNPEIEYCHSIMGVSEAYLEKIQKGEVGDSKDYFGSDIIDSITMRVVTSGCKDILKKIKAGLSLFSKVEYSEAIGHESIVLNIKDESVESFLKLLISKGFATHQNPLYGQGIYNIETSICIKKEDLNLIEEEMAKEPDGKGRIWCSYKIEKYCDKLEKVFEEGDESLYSYYVGLIQTLNTLAQYEQFDLSKDIFYLLFPAIQMFDTQMDVSLEQGRNLEELKESICQFLESVNSIIYHTIHTDQVFLMIPGYSGTTFSIPIKLCLLYSCFIKDVIEILNDSKECYKYECLLVPVVEAKPKTELINLGLPHGDRLISVKLSQRSLYMPRDLMIILAHEVAHYVGDGIRNRKKRLEYIIRTISMVIAEGIIPCDIREESRIAKEFVRVNRNEITKFMIVKLTEALRAKCSQSGYHAEDIKEEIENQCELLLTDVDTGVYKIIYGITNLIRNIIEEQKISAIEQIREYQQQFDSNRKRIYTSGIIGSIVEKLVKIYREVFSDMVAVKLLGFDEDLFQEAFRISEGKYLDEDDMGNEGRRRKAIINSIRGACKKTLPDEGSTSQIRDKEYKWMINNLYDFDGTVDLLMNYAKLCYKDIGDIMEGQKDKVNNIRTLFQLFKGSNNLSCKNIYSIINVKISDYTEYIRKQHEEILKEP